MLITSAISPPSFVAVHSQDPHCIYAGVCQCRHDMLTLELVEARLGKIELLQRRSILEHLGSHSGDRLSDSLSR